ncbi:MAG: DUF1501 domain-containing protein [Anaerolineae bacterium]
MNRKTTTVSRRDFLKRSAALTALASAQIALPSWMPRLGISKNGAPGDVLVCVFLRGGADGLNIIVPHGETAYYAARPRLAVARPDDTRADAENKSLDLDGFFGLNPALAPMLPLFKGGQMVAVHGTGTPAETRSHFDAMSYMERGVVPGGTSSSSGWIGRHLQSLELPDAGLVRAIGWGDALQTSLRGSINAVSIKSIVDYHLGGRDEAAAQMLSALNTLYHAGDEALQLAAEQTRAVLDLVSRINIADYKPAGGAQYDDQSDFDMALMQTAALIKADIGLEVSAIDLGGWDTHQNEQLDLPPLLTTLANGLAAFHTDMGERMSRISVVVMSEFGRRVQENGSNGTDHGYGNMMLLMGGHLIGKPVVADWIGLAPELLHNGDVPITIDYRDILTEVITHRLKNPNVSAVFPNFTPTPRGIVLP